MESETGFEDDSNFRSVVSSFLFWASANEGNGRTPKQ